MKWKRSYYALALLVLSLASLSGCGVRKKVVVKSATDSTRVHKETSQNIITQNTVTVSAETTTSDIIEFKATETFFDSTGRKTHERSYEGRRRQQKQQRQDSTVADSAGTDLSIEIDSTAVKKEATVKNKDSDTSLLRNVGQWTIVVCFSIAVVVFFVYRWLKDG